MLKLDAVVKKNNNNFNLIRLIAAVLVVYGHSFELFRNNGFEDPVKKILIDDYSGSIAVYFFFFLSGIFILMSFNTSKTFFSFLIKRVFRIWPALIICIFLTTILIGPLFTSLNISQYFQSYVTWRYLVKNALLFKDYIKYLPGVFVNNHLSAVVNGSLWTLPTEIKCYFLIFLFGGLSLLKTKVNIAILFILAIVLYLLNIDILLRFFLFSQAAKNFLFFIGGSLCYSWRKYIIVDFRLALLLIISCIFLYHRSLFFPVFYLTLCYSVLTLGAANCILKIRLPGDYSYGIYIYGFLVQQIVQAMFPSLTSYCSLLITIPITTALSVLSWHFIEFPANKKGHRIAEFYEKNFAIARIDATYKEKINTPR